MTSRADGREAEHALVAALVLGHARPADLSGRVSGEDFFDPAAGLIFTTVMGAAAGGRRVDPSSLPSLLRAAGELRSDGYPIRPLLDWLPTVSVPAHPEAWGGLVVASALTRQVEAAGVRMQQASDGYRDLVWGAGRVLAVAAAQRATVHQALVRWESLPGSWRYAVTATLQPVPTTPAARTAARTVAASGRADAAEDVVLRRPASHDEKLLEQELLAGLVAAPQLMDRVRWLHPRDFTDPAHGQLYTALRQLHVEGRPIDLVTLAASLPGGGSPGDPMSFSSGPPSESLIEPESPVLQVCRSLAPHRACPAMVPWMARQQLETSLLLQAEQTGLDLVRIAEAPVAVGGLGGPALRAAVARLDDFTDEGRRLDAAQRVAPSRDDADRGSTTVTRLHGLDQSVDPNVPHGRDVARPSSPREDDRDTGNGHLDRTAG